MKKIAALSPTSCLAYTAVYAVFLCFVSLLAARAAGPHDATTDTVLDLTFEKLTTESTKAAVDTAVIASSGGFKIETIGTIEVLPQGPSEPLFKGMPANNLSAEIGSRGSYLRIKDSKEAGPLDFNVGDPITIEAWVRPKSVSSGSHVYVVSKGRTYESANLENHNYALRLTGSGSAAKISFLFSSAANATAGSTNAPAAQKLQYHRWTSNSGFAIDLQWHHVAVSYRFGVANSISGYIDGERVTGKWDMAGATSAAPVVSNESVWIGSSRGGDPNNSFAGGLDDVRIHRAIVAPKKLVSRRVIIVRAPEIPKELDPSRVLVTLHEQAGNYRSFPLTAPKESFRYGADLLAFHRLPLKYVPGGLRDRWQGPVLLRAFAKTKLPEGNIQLLLRSPGLTRVWIDGEIAIETPARRLFPDAHQPFIVYESDVDWLREPHVGDREVRIPFASTPGEHEIVVESMVGSSSSRCETGETLLAFRFDDGMFTVLGPSHRVQSDPIALTNADFGQYLDRAEQQLSRIDYQRLVEESRKEDSYWDQRHETAREFISTLEPLPKPGSNKLKIVSHGKLDDYWMQSLSTADTSSPSSFQLFNDIDTPAAELEFLRRLSLDLRGIPPSVEEIEEYLQYEESTRNKEFSQRFVRDNRWADHWTSYWQDVLAENPNILKPSLNNTGPFRWWINDALRINKPMDRFVTELILMDADSHAGGPAGFGIATENDVPMAEKAHIIASAFLGVDMKCARCHDSPYHPWSQRDLFSIGAMLKKSDIKVPASSSVPTAFFDRKDEGTEIQVTLQPGDVVNQTFPEAIAATAELQANLEIPDSQQRSSRKQLAYIVSGPESLRFPKVLVNRVWTRMFGWGLVESTDDWYEAEPKFEPLLDFLAREFVATGYDLRELAVLISSSRIYQRAALDRRTAPEIVQYAAPWQKRLSAEQMVDSLHAVTGRNMTTEVITFDPEASQKTQNFLNLGVASRSWQLTSLSNERDRPSLSLPRASAVAECLEAFGWRSTRQAPVTHRESEANLVQPGVVANSHLATWVTRLTDDSRLTQWCLDAETPTALVNHLFLAILSRPPSDEELAAFVSQIENGFDARISTASASRGLPPPNRGYVTWSNHFDVKANELMRDIERELGDGPNPSQRIDTQWRERAEDAVWALVNSPEFQLIR